MTKVITGHMGHLDLLDCLDKKEREGLQGSQESEGLGATRGHLGCQARQVPRVLVDKMGKTAFLGRLDQREDLAGRCQRCTSSRSAESCSALRCPP